MIISGIRKIFRSDLYAGVFLIVISYAGFIVPSSYKNNPVSLVIGGSFFLGAIFLCNYISIRLNRVSLLDEILGSKKEKWRFFIFSGISGALFELIGNHLGGLWYYPQWSFQTYLIVGFILGGWMLYILFLVIAYESAKLLFDRIVFKKRLITKYFKHEHIVYYGCIIAAVCVVVVVAHQAVVTPAFVNQLNLAVNHSRPMSLGWTYSLYAGLAIILLAEFTEYIRHRTSFLKDILHGYVNPLYAILLSGLVMAIFNEAQNLNVFIWRYGNFPFPDLMVSQIPVSAIIGWQIHILLFIELWRAFGSRLSSKLFEPARRAR